MYAFGPVLISECSIKDVCCAIILSQLKTVQRDHRKSYVALIFMSTLPVRVFLTTVYCAVITQAVSFLETDKQIEKNLKLYVYFQLMNYKRFGKYKQFNKE